MNVQYLSKAKTDLRAVADGSGIDWTKPGPLTVAVDKVPPAEINKMIDAFNGLREDAQEWRQYLIVTREASGYFSSGLPAETFKIPPRKDPVAAVRMSSPGGNCRKLVRVNRGGTMKPMRPTGAPVESDTGVNGLFKQGKNLFRWPGIQQRDQNNAERTEYHAGDDFIHTPEAAKR